MRYRQGLDGQVHYLRMSNLVSNPMLLTSAKALGSGIPIGAMLAKEKVADSFQPGTHGSTFGGNPIATTAGIATIETILNEGILPQVKLKSLWLVNELKKLQASFPSIEGIKGLGLLIGIQMTGDIGYWITQFREKGILVLSAGNHVLRILPPLTTTEEELAHFIAIFKEILAEEDAKVLG